MAYLVIAVLLLLAWRLRAQAGWRDAAGWLIFLVVLQLLTGLSNVVLGWPLLAAVLHTGGAAALAMVLAWCLARSRSTQAEYAGALPTSGFAA
jgi:cytochrome c oxidase assembly protein subunit 15